MDVKTIQMVDLGSQTQRIRAEIDSAIASVISGSAFIQGKEVGEFSKQLEVYLGVNHVIPCANGTDALQIALMALDLAPGSEVITPGFSYAAVAEVCALLHLKPVFADVDNDTFNLNPLEIEKHINAKTKAIVPVHLFGQCCDMETIMAIAEKHNLKVVEDNAQSLGADMIYSDGSTVKAGTIGHIGTTSFFPSKNLGCFGDGGALFTNDARLAEKIRSIANHGQKEKYKHDFVGVNSRLDSIQAAVLKVKLNYLNTYIEERKQVAAYYDEALKDISAIKLPERSRKSTHVYNQYTLQVFGMDRLELKSKLLANGIPSMVYYPLPLYKQKAYKDKSHLPVTEALCETVLSLPIGTDMEKTQLEYITKTILKILKQE